MGDFAADKLLAEADELAKGDGFVSLMAMPQEKRSLYARLAKAVLTERERCARLANYEFISEFVTPEYAKDVLTVTRWIAASIRKGEA